MQITWTRIFTGHFYDIDPIYQLNFQEWYFFLKKLPLYFITNDNNGELGESSSINLLKLILPITI